MTEPMQEPAKIPLTFEVGVDNYFSFRRSNKVAGVLVPIDLTGLTATSQIRTAVGGPVLLDLTPHTTMNSEGLIEITVSAADASSGALRGARGGVWDMKLTDASGYVVTFAFGTVKLVQDVTR